MRVYARGEELVCHLSLDEDLLGALEGFSGGAFVFDGSGALRDIDLEDEDGNRRKIAAAEILSLRGVATEGRVEVHGTFLRGAQAIGGRVWSARVARCIVRGSIFAAAGAAEHFQPESLGDARVPAAPEPGAGGGWAAAMAASAASDAAPAGGGWAAAIQASEAAVEANRPHKRRRTKAPTPGTSASRMAPPIVRSAKSRASGTDFLNEPIPEAGDFVDHKQFGICKVVRSLDDALVIKLASGRTKQIKLTVLEVLPAREDTNRVIYPLRPRKR